ncbi:MAG: hypothetical protein ACK4K7_06675 [Allosphingosinicella sp.]|uniref:hypothetical protein n=1 Tax=Allosphingosinicella sp. TaxID=2823234 RepID=UPI0039222702
MDANAIITGIFQGGPVAVACYLLLQHIKAAAADRLSYDKERLETDKRIASALTALAIFITGKPDGHES